MRVMNVPLQYRSIVKLIRYCKYACMMGGGVTVHSISESRQEVPKTFSCHPMRSRFIYLPRLLARMLVKETSDLVHNGTTHIRRFKEQLMLRIGYTL